ncbi:MAG: hypothetical protein PHI03_10345 [Bacteroidales bacterium]|nr:hypothetical protein [Bacteroidales bacterium]
MGTIVIIVIVIFIGLVIIGSFGKSDEKNKLKEKYSARDNLELSEFESVLTKNIIKVHDFEHNNLLTFYPAWTELLGMDDDGAVRASNPSSSKSGILSNRYETDIAELNQELNGNYTLLFNIATDVEIETIQVIDSLDSYHVLEFIEALVEGFWVIEVSEFSKKTGIKIYINNENNEEEEISYTSAILIKNEDGVTKSLTLRSSCITKNHEVKHLIKK